MNNLNESFEREKKEQQEKLAEQDSRLALVVDDGYGRMVFESKLDS